LRGRSRLKKKLLARATQIVYGDWATAEEPSGVAVKVKESRSSLLLGNDEREPKTCLKQSHSLRPNIQAIFLCGLKRKFFTNP